MQSIILVLHVLVAIAIISLVLLQHGRGADVGAAFGSGSSNTMFGSVGALPFLLKLTAICAVVFFATSITLSYMASANAKHANDLAMPALPVKTTTTTAPEPVIPISFAPQSTTGDNNKK